MSRRGELYIVHSDRDEVLLCAKDGACSALIYLTPAERDDLVVKLLLAAPADNSMDPVDRQKYYFITSQLQSMVFKQAVDRFSRSAPQQRIKVETTAGGPNPRIDIPFRSSLSDRLLRLLRVRALSRWLN